MKNKDKLLSVLPSILSILLGLFIGWYLLFISNPVDSLSGVKTILFGAFTDGRGGIGNLLYIATPIVLTGLSVGFSIKTGLFNIGASGQFTVGAFAAIFVGVKFTFLPAILHCVVAVLAGVIAGGIWGLLSGYLKARFNVSEVISGILLNYIGMLLVNLLSRKFIYDDVYNRTQSVAKTAMIPNGIFESLFPGSRVNISFALVLITVFLIRFILNKSTIGYEFRITGKNKYAGQYAGMNYVKDIILSMVIAGMLSGFAGALMYLSDFGDHIVIVDTILQQGFTGISVALLGMSNPIGILFSGLFIADITIGGNYLQLYGYSSDIVDIIISIIVYCGALVIPTRILIEKFKDKKKTKEVEE